MANAWQTVEEAAHTLGISSRTLHRRIARGEVETRLEAGRREVLVTLPDANEAPAADMPSFDLTETSPSDAASTAMSDEVGQTMLALHEDRIRRTDLAIMAYQQSVTNAAREARRSRVGSRWAWATASMALVALVLGATWATHKLSRTEAQVDILSSTLRTLSTEAQEKSMEADKLREQAEAARIAAENARVAAAHAEGELSATKAQLASVKLAPQPPAPMINLIDPMKLVSAK